MEIKEIKNDKEERCLRCGMSKKDIRKENHGCGYYGKYYPRHIYK